MWRSLWRSIDRFSLQYFKYVINELRETKVINKFNKESIVDILQSIVEIVTYGDKHDPTIFECFMEYQVMAEFVRVLKISKNSRIEAPLLQYLSIMIQNMESEHTIYYCFSNDYVNSIIGHQYEFDGGDLIPYYISFLRAVSSKINKDTLCLLVKVNEDVVVSFPLYTEALKFARHGEKMIQIAVRAVTLNIYKVSDDMVYQYVTTPPNSDYFSDLVQSLREQCFQLDALVRATEESWTHERRKELVLKTDKIVDDLYYFKDILSVGESHLNILITENLLSLLVYPILLPLLQLSDTDDTDLLPITSLYLVSQILQVVDGKGMINSVAGLVLYPYVASSVEAATEGITTNCLSQAYSFLNHLSGTHKSVYYCRDDDGGKNNSKNGHFKNLSEYLSLISGVVSRPFDNVQRERSGLLIYIFSDNYHLLLASLFLLMILTDSKDLDFILAAVIGASHLEKTHDVSADAVDGSIFARYMPQILNALLKVLASQPPFSVLIQWHTGWFLRKLLVFKENVLCDNDFHLFKTSYQQSCENLIKELNGCWFDFIPDALRKEWASCKSALEVSFQSKDAFFTLDLDFHNQDIDGNMGSSLAWRKMVDAVKVFVLHLQLKSFICKGDLVGNPLMNLRSNVIAISGMSPASDILSADFGSELALGSAVPSKIAFSKLGLKDIYLIAAARGISGKLFLLDKHPFRNQRGIILATAPLAGLNPKIDQNHPTWLHLRIRDFDPKFISDKTRNHHSSEPNHVADGRWTLGFPNAEACEAARLYICEEISKQRSAVENLLAPLLQESNFLGDLSDN